MAVLDKKDIFEIKILAQKTRGVFGIGMGALGDNIFQLARKMGIRLIFVPIEIDPTRTNPFSALYVAIEESKGEKFRFIGLNTADYFDKQIFFVAHEMYHHLEETERITVCHGLEDADSLRELKANRFAAEFLLPSETLEREIQEVNQGDTILYSWNKPALLRLIARIHCDFKLPYKAIVRRLREVGSITDNQLNELAQENVRDPDGDYYLIAANIDQMVFESLNKPTEKFGVDGDVLNRLLQNYEDNYVSLSELAEDLSHVGKELSNFRLEEEVDPVDLADMDFLVSD